MVLTVWVTSCDVVLPLVAVLGCPLLLGNMSFFTINCLTFCLKKFIYDLILCLSVYYLVRLLTLGL